MSTEGWGVEGVAEALVIPVPEGRKTWETYKLVGSLVGCMVEHIWLGHLQDRRKCPN